MISRQKIGANALIRSRRMCLSLSVIGNAILYHVNRLRYSKCMASMSTRDPECQRSHLARPLDSSHRNPASSGNRPYCASRVTIVQDEHTDMCRGRLRLLDAMALFIGTRSGANRGNISLTMQQYRLPDLQYEEVDTAVVGACLALACRAVQITQITGARSRQCSRVGRQVPAQLDNSPLSVHCGSAYSRARRDPV
jgi:hypothetical protein